MSHYSKMIRLASSMASDSPNRRALLRLFSGGVGEPFTKKEAAQAKVLTHYWKLENHLKEQNDEEGLVLLDRLATVLDI